MTNNIITELNAFNGEVVEIVTNHIWYGNQRIICPLLLVDNDACISFQIGKQKLNIEKEKVNSFYKENQTYYILTNSINMFITVK